MECATSIRDRTRAPLGVAGLIGLVVLIESCLAWFERDLTLTLEISWVFAREAAKAVKNFEVLGLGSSRVKHGLSPKVVADVTGRPTYNLAVFGGRMATTYFVLRKVLASGSRPRVVLVDIDVAANDDLGPSARNEEFRWVLSYMHSFAGLSGLVDLARTAGDPDVLVRGLLASTLPSYRKAVEIRMMVDGYVKGRLGSPGNMRRAYLRNWLVNGGWHATTLVARPAAVSALPAPVEWRGREGYVNNPVTGAYTKKFLDLASAHGVRVVWLFPPLGPVSHRWAVESGREGYARELARTTLRERAGTAVLDGRYSGYPDEAFSDGDHLNTDGAGALSEAVAAALNRLMADDTTAERWVTLPPYRPREVVDPLETVEQSLWFVALQGRPTRR